ncbi:MAG: Rid family hydrolase [Myxococcota bacterium]
MGAHNRYRGEVLAYAPVHGAGAAVVSLVPSEDGVGIKEFDEDDVERFGGDREVLASAPVTAAVATSQAEILPLPTPETAIHAATAPRPVGAYPHARRVGDMLYLSGIGPRDPADDSIPGGPIRDASGAPRDYDIEAQTEAVIANVRRVLEAAGSSLDRVVDVTAFLVDMDRDFAGYNAVYARHFTTVGATRTTVAVSALPTPIAVEFKVTALAGKAP